MALPPDIDEQLDWVKWAGFDGVEGWPPGLQDTEAWKRALKDRNLRFGASSYIPEGADPEPVFQAAAAAGADYVQAQVDGYWKSDTWVLDRTREMMRLGEKYSLPFHLETHRGRYTQDMRRTLMLLGTLPDLQLCGDFSHYVSSSELKAPWKTAWREPLHQIAARCGMLHGRMNAGQRVQDPLAQISPEQKGEFLATWKHAQESQRARPGSADRRFTFTAELLVSDYQITDLSGSPTSDLLAETVELLAMARETLG